MREYVFLNTAFGVNSISEEEIEINIPDPIYGMSKKEAEEICRKAISMAFEIYNPNAFLHGLAGGHGTPSITFYPDVKDGKLIFVMGLYGGWTSVSEGTKVSTETLTISTPLPAREESYVEENGDESYVVSKFYVEK